jgi:hypothetical protein
MLLRPMLWMLDALTDDVVLTREELNGLAANLLVSSTPATCPTRFSEWLAANTATVGRKYASEIERHFVRNEAACVNCGAAQTSAKSSRSAIAR